MRTIDPRLLGGLAASAALLLSAAAATEGAPSAQEARQIAAEAYLYGFPVVDTYKTLWDQAVDVGGPDFKAPFNQIGHASRVATPDDKAIITPNSDTPYSFLWMDLRAEPLVLMLPKMDPKRYFAVQLVDLYTHNFAYLGRRATGSDGGAYLIAGPHWRGAAPEGVTAVIRCETEIAYALYRTQLFDAKDLAEVRKLQEEYRVQTLSAFAGTPAPPASPLVSWPPPSADMLDSLSLFEYLNFLLSFAPTHPSERELMQRFARIGIAAGKPFDATALDPALRQALEAGVADAKAQFAEFKRTRIDTHEVSSASFFGTREELQNNYLYRFAGARLGIYGNSAAEAVYVGGFVDADGAPLDGTKHRYALRFGPGGLPPNEAFWSLTMYDGRTQLLVANPLGRYLINSTMESRLTRDADGGVTLYVQADPPGSAKEPNWLPAPKGPFYTVLRIYQPKRAVQDGTWVAPPLRRVE
jgi:hypothetical protein